MVLVDSVVGGDEDVLGGEETVVGSPPADASWNSAMLSGKTSTLSLYFAREFPF